MRNRLSDDLVGRRGTYLLFLVITFPFVSFAATIHVPLDQPTIQAGIAAAATGDTVLVSAGQYSGPGNQDISFGGRNVVVLGEAGASATIIDCQGSVSAPHRGFVFESDEDSLAVLDGFTIRNGYTSTGGGAVLCRYNTAPIIRNCVFESCYGYQGGAILVDGGLMNYDTKPVFRDCDIRNNTSASGGGVHVTNSGQIYLTACRITDNTAVLCGGVAIGGLSWGSLDSCLIAGNSATGTTGNAGGGGLFFGEPSSPQVRNCTIVNNSSLHLGSALHAAFMAGPRLEKCIVAFNDGPQTISCESGMGEAHVRVVCSDVYGNSGGDWTGCIMDQSADSNNFSADPLFCAPARADYTLKANSPCMPEASPCAQLVGYTAQPCVCCTGMRGNVDGDFTDVVDISDLTQMVAHLFELGPISDCPEENDLDGSESVDIADLTWLVGYLFEAVALLPCP